MILGYGGNKTEEEHNIEAGVGRVRIGKFSMQIEEDILPYQCPSNGQLSVMAFFFGPESTPDGVDRETSISITSNGERRFADVPVAILPEAVPLAQHERTRRVLERFIQIGNRPKPADPAM